MEGTKGSRVRKKERRKESKDKVIVDLLWTSGWWPQVTIQYVLTELVHVITQVVHEPY